MKKTFAILITLLCSLCLSAQNINAFKQSIQSGDPTAVNSLVINEHGSAAKSIQQYAQRSQPDKIKGYRIRIFVDKSQNARERANAAMSSFKASFPGIPAYISYEKNVYFTVSVGNCATLEEALILLAAIKGEFSGAYWKNEDIPVEILYNRN